MAEQSAMVSVEDRRRIRDAARRVLLQNRRQGYDRRYHTEYSYTCPSPGRYRWQWFWDSCFHIIALSHLDMEAAKAELVSLLVPQEEDGFIGHVTFWGPRPFVETWARFESLPRLRPRHTQLIQPPALAQALAAVFRRSADVAFLEQMLPKVERFYRWLEDNRDPDGDSLIAIISPFESGLDHKPAYDEPLGFRMEGKRGRLALEWRARRIEFANVMNGFDSRRILAKDIFNVEDVMVNSIYAQGLRCLAELHGATGRRAEAETWARKAQAVGQALLSKSYDSEAGAFWDLSGREEHPLRKLTFSALFPLILPDTPREVVQRLMNHLLDSAEFWPRYPVPSVALSEPSFIPGECWCLWRGPTWMNVNWFLVGGLRLHGFEAEAGALVEKSLELVLREGFREFYNPLTGEGLGAAGFGWTTLVVDMMEQSTR